MMFDHNLEQSFKMMQNILKRVRGDYNEISFASTLVVFAGVPSAALYPPAMSYPFYQPVIQPMVNIKVQLKSNL